jgi:hypothetical protein
MAEYFLMSCFRVQRGLERDFLAHSQLRATVVKSGNLLAEPGDVSET